MIYILGSQDGNPLKVGFSANPASRLDGLQGGHPFKLSVLRVWPHAAAERVERYAHERLRQFRMAGEWFLTDVETAVAAVESAIAEVDATTNDHALPPGKILLDEALREAVHRLGGLRAAGRALGVAHQAIMRWGRTPPVRVLEIERLTGVSRHALRPDIYPIEDDRKSNT